jgi:BclB C-terminal domain-containing protein
VAGAIGATGEAGAIGATGPTGATGSAGAGAIIPYSSGAPVALTTVAGGLAGTVAMVGFGLKSPQVIVLGTIIQTNIPNLAFSVPRDGTITSLSAYFSTTVALNLPQPTTIQAQVWRSAAPATDTFTPNPGAVVTLSPPLSGIQQSELLEGEIFLVLNIPVSQGDCLLLVFSISSTGLAKIVTGFASAGLGIS